MLYLLGTRPHPTPNPKGKLSLWFDIATLFIQYFKFHVPRPPNPILPAPAQTLNVCLKWLACALVWTPIPSHLPAHPIPSHHPSHASCWKWLACAIVFFFFLFACCATVWLSLSSPSNPTSQPIPSHHPSHGWCWKWLACGIVWFVFAPAHSIPPGACYCLKHWAGCRWIIPTAMVDGAAVEFWEEHESHHATLWQKNIKKTARSVERWQNRYFTSDVLYPQKPCHIYLWLMRH